MQPTSIAAYREVTADGTIASQQAQILAALDKMEDRKGTGYQITIAMRRVKKPLSYNQVMRRTKELYVNKQLVKAGTEKSKTSSPSQKKAIVWAVAPQEGQAV